MTIQIDDSQLCSPLVSGESSLVGKFTAMGSPCEILIDTQDINRGRRMFDYAVGETRRIEKKFSRYLSGNTLDRINAGARHNIAVDSETSDLLDFATACFDLSDGLFDITTGVLRKVWRFDGGPTDVQQQEVERLLPFVGWNKVKWKRPLLEIPSGFEIDLGGICKEYAADRIADHLIENYKTPVLVNLGGDVAARGNRFWTVGIEDVHRAGSVVTTLNLKGGALTTSGDTKRFALINGKRLGHILNPRTGWPVADTPKSVTVAASTCTEAGFLSTLAMLHGARAEAFLAEQEVKFWCYR